MDFENPGLKDWALRFVRRRCPGLSGSELEEAVQNLLDYMEVVWDIYKRLESEGRLEEVAQVRKEMEREHRLSLMCHLVSLLSYYAVQIERRTAHDSKPPNR